MTRLKIYISGPLSNGGKLSDEHQEKHVWVAIATWRDLIELGFAPICPHLTYYANKLYPQTYKDLLESVLPLVDVSDAVLRLDGKSKGAQAECLRAVNQRIPVYKSLRELKGALCPSA